MELIFVAVALAAVVTFIVATIRDERGLPRDEPRKGPKRAPLKIVETDCDVTYVYPDSRDVVEQERHLTLFTRDPSKDTEP